MWLPIQARARLPRGLLQVAPPRPRGAGAARGAAGFGA